MNISEFRKDLKKYFDLAAQGQTIHIERGGLHFLLVNTEQMKSRSTHVAVDHAFAQEYPGKFPDEGQMLREPGMTYNPDIAGFVKNGKPVRHAPEKIEPVATQQNTDEFTEAGKVTEVPACCKAAKPCRHWQFDGGQQAWINSITGESREVSQ